MGVKGLSLLSGGLDSQLAVRVLERAGAAVEGVCFSSPFFAPDAAKKAAAALGIKLHVVDFTDDEIAIIENPPHGFGGAMNPCIDCHAAMIRRAGELMEKLGYEKSSGLKGRLIRPLSAKRLEPTIPETEGKVDRGKLLGISGRSRARQIELAAVFGIVDYPSPAGGCKLTEDGFGRKLRDLMEHEGLKSRRLVEMLLIARRFRLPDGSGVLLGRDKNENAILKSAADIGTVVTPVNCPGPTAVITDVKSDADLRLTAELVCSYSKYDRLDGDIVIKVGDASSLMPRPYDRTKFKEFQIC